MQRLGVNLKEGFQDDPQKTVEERGVLDRLQLIQRIFPKLPCVPRIENTRIEFWERTV